MFSIELYNNTAESNRLDKTDYLEDVVVLNGTLREGCSVIDPVVLIESGVNTVINRNYARIASFNRWYFINNYTFITTNLIQLELHVDVLMSFKDEIVNLTGYLLRTGKGEYQNVNIEDKQLSFTGELDIEINEIDVFNVNGTNFKGFNLLSNDDKITFIAMTVMTSDYTEPNYPKINSEQFGIVKMSENVVANYKGKALLTQFITGGTNNPKGGDCLDTFDKIVDKYFNDTAIQSFILGIYVYPFGFDESNFNVDELIKNGTSGETFLRIGDSEKRISISDEFELPLIYTLSPGAIKAPCQYFRYRYRREFNDFRDLSPYTQIYILLPFYGLIEIDPAFLIDTPYIHITYVCNYTDGMATIYVGFGDTDNNIATVFYNSYRCTIAVNLPKNSSTWEDQNRAIIGQTVNMISGTLGGAAKGFGSGGPIGAATGAVGNAVEGIGNIINAAVLNPVRGEKADLTLVNNSLCCKLFKKPYIYIYRNISSINPTDENYNSICGRPSMKIATINSLQNGGYSQFYQIHTDNVSATSDEKDEIEKILTSGFLY